MTTTTSNPVRPAWALAALGLASLLAWPAAGAAPATGQSASAPALSAQQIYQRDRAACLLNVLPREQRNCLRDAAVARQERERGELGNGVDAKTLAANALKRCEVHTDPDAHEACVRMAQGEGRQSGSVAKGAVVKEYVTRKVGEPASAPAAR